FGVDPAQPRMAPVDTAIEFGTVATNQPLDKQLVVKNNGGSALKITAATFSNPVFRLAAPSLPVSIDPKGQVSLTVRFAPSAAGAQSGTLTLSNNDPLSPSTSVALSGTGTPPAGPILEIKAGAPPAAVTSWELGTVAPNPSQPPTVVF